MFGEWLWVSSNSGLIFSASFYCFWCLANKKVQNGYYVYTKWKSKSVKTSFQKSSRKYTSIKEQKWIFQKAWSYFWKSLLSLSIYILDDYRIIEFTALQGTWKLVQEDPTCCGATKPWCHNCWACALDPGSSISWAHTLQLLNPACAR